MPALDEPTIPGLYWLVDSTYGTLLALTGRLTIDVPDTSPAIRITRAGVQLPWSINPAGANDVYYASGAEFAAGSAVARATSASLFRQSGGQHLYYGDSGLVAGNTFTPTLRAQLEANGNFNATGTNSKFGAGVTSNAATYLRVGDQGDAANVYLIADSLGGGPANIGTIIRSKGTSNVQLQDFSGNVMCRTDVAALAAGESALWVRMNAGGTVLRRLEVDAVDTAGVGYRRVRVLN